MASVVSDAHELGAGRAVDLSHLSEAERTVLRLLAQGHTVKSIASALGSTPTAINERLRQARRKTGVGSSREVARLLSAHENRPEKIEVVIGAGRRSHEPDAGAGRIRRYCSGALIMIAALAAALGIAAHLAEQPSARTAPASAAMTKPVPHIYYRGFLMGSPKWWEEQGLVVGTPIYDKKGTLLGTVDRMEPDNDVVRNVIVRSADGRRDYAAVVGGMSESGTTWTATVYELRASR